MLVVVWFGDVGLKMLWGFGVPTPLERSTLLQWFIVRKGWRSRNADWFAGWVALNVKARLTAERSLLFPWNGGTTRLVNKEPQGHRVKTLLRKRTTTPRRDSFLRHGERFCNLEGKLSINSNLKTSTATKTTALSFSTVPTALSSSLPPLP